MTCERSLPKHILAIQDRLRRRSLYILVWAVGRCRLRLRFKSKWWREKRQGEKIPCMTLEDSTITCMTLTKSSSPYHPNAQPQKPSTTTASTAATRPVPLPPSSPQNLPTTTTTVVVAHPSTPPPAQALSEARPRLRPKQPRKPTLTYRRLWRRGWNPSSRRSRPSKRISYG